jgi:hypothetical protein
MANYIALVVLLVSFAGLVFILVKKLPVLAKMHAPAAASSRSTVVDLKNKMKEALNPIGLDYELYLQKILSKVRVLTLKTENKTANWLEALRQRSKRNSENSKDYWEELKKAKEGREK